jgi:CheY-like chemotaxis protein
MKLRHRTIARFVIAIAACCLAAAAAAQAPKAKAAKADKPAAAKAEKKPALKPKPPAAKPEKKPAAPPPAAEAESAMEDPAVAAILGAKPTTPAECASAAKTLLDLGHPDLAKRFLKQVLDARLTVPQLADLGEQFGTVMFLDMAGQPALRPEARQLADAVVAAAAARRADPKRIAGLIEQLQDPSAEKRMQSLAGLQEAQAAAIGPLLAVLADPARAAEHANVRTVLATMGRLAREPLVAVLQGADPKLLVQAILVLAEMGQRRAAIDMVGPCVSEKSTAEVREAAAAALRQLTGHVPTRPEALRLLRDMANIYFNRRQPIEYVVDGKVELWQWDDRQRQLTVHSGTPADAARALAARFARQAYALDPNDHEIQLLYLATLLDAAAHARGLDRPLDERDPALAAAKPFGVRAIQEVLRYAMAHRRPAAAAAAARLLGEIGKAREVFQQGDRPSPLVLALQDPDRRLRMAALETIVRLQPSGPFAGSSYVPSALSFFVASSGTRRVLVAGPSLDEARTLGGLLAAAGFQADAATTGKELLRLATHSPDYESLWIDVSISHPVIATLLEELRRGGRTASLPVGLIARSGYLPEAEHLAELDPLAKAFARPHDEKTVREQLAELTSLAPEDTVDFDTRERQAARALDLLVELSQSSSGLYDLRHVQDAVLVAVYNRRLAAKAVAVLANLNSAESQRALVEVASRFTQPLALRQAAAAAFCENRAKHGILLTSAEIRAQYARYNRSEKQDAATRHVLGLILDCLEASAKSTPVDKTPGAPGP